MPKTTDCYKARDAKKMKLSQLYLMGFSAQKIAHECDISKATCHRMIQELEAEWEQFWMPAINSVRTKKVAELNNLKSQAYTALMVAQKQGDLLLVKQFGDLILKVIHTENKIFQLYSEGYRRNDINLEELLQQYESSKQKISERDYGTDLDDLLEQNTGYSDRDDIDDGFDEIGDDLSVDY